LATDETRKNTDKDRNLKMELLHKEITAGDEAQQLNELKATGIKVGLLINFGRTEVEFKRLVL
jgi:GxxExxY protein